MSNYKNFLSVVSLIIVTIFLPEICFENNYCEASETNAFLNVFGNKNYDVGRVIKQTADGGYIILGDTAFWGLTKAYYYLLRLDSDGIEVWSRTFSDASRHSTKSLAVIQGGDYLLADCYHQTVLRISDCGELIERIALTDFPTLRIYSLVQTSDGGFILAGATIVDSEKKACLVKVDNTFHKKWEHIFDRGIATAISQTGDGSYVSSGWLEDEHLQTSDIFLLKVSESGETQWYKIFRKFDGCVTDTLYKTEDNGFLIGGGRTQRFPYDGFILKTDAAGNEVWTKWYSENELGVLSERTFSLSKEQNSSLESDVTIVNSITSGAGGGFCFTVNVWVAYSDGKIAYLVHSASSSEIEWVKHLYFDKINYKGSFVSSVCTTVDGGYAMTGSVYLQNLNDQVVAYKVNSTGNFQ